MRNTMLNRMLMVATVAVAATLTGACASADPQTTDTTAAPQDATVFTVRNNDGAGRDLIIYLVPEARGERRTLGTVAAGGTASFNFAAPRGYYTLLGAHNLGEVASERFNVTGPSAVLWTMRPSRVVVNPR